ncbi:Heparan-sulfate 6-O-sulfotransferase 3-B, partial [Bulinus truncatus]
MSLSLLRGNKSQSLRGKFGRLNYGQFLQSPGLNASYASSGLTQAVLIGEILATYDEITPSIRVGSLSFNINKSDVMVVMHIQKTGGTTFETFLAHHTNIKPPCHCSVVMYNYKRDVCSCLNNKGQDWMVNRHSTGWVCGVHADFTDLTECVDKWFNSQDNERRRRSYHYVTMIRDPVSRFISEWLHVRRGATWKESRLHCDGRDASLQEVPFCFQQGSWTGVTFDEFLNCS